MPQKPPIVLVHGAWAGAWCWKRVLAPLRSAGHEVHAVTLTGVGERAHLLSREVSLATHIDDVLGLVEAEELADVVLVGHSYGGTIISKVAEAIPDRIRRLVYWSGFVLNDGESLNDAVPPHFRDLFRDLAADSPDNSVMLPFPIWRETFLNDADLDLARSAYDKLSPEPYQQIIEPLDLKRFYTLDIPRSYLLGTEDIALPPGEWGWHPRMTSRLGLHRFVQMPGGHELLFSNPNGLADRIIESGRD